MNNFQDMTDFQAFVKESLSQGQTENALKAINVFCDRVRLRTSFINASKFARKRRIIDKETYKNDHSALNVRNLLNSKTDDYSKLMIPSEQQQKHSYVEPSVAFDGTMPSTPIKVKEEKFKEFESSPPSVESSKNASTSTNTLDTIVINHESGVNVAAMYQDHRSKKFLTQFGVNITSKSQVEKILEQRIKVEN